MRRRGGPEKCDNNHHHNHNVGCAGERSAQATVLVKCVGRCSFVRVVAVVGVVVESHVCTCDVIVFRHTSYKRNHSDTSIYARNIVLECA